MGNMGNMGRMACLGCHLDLSSVREMEVDT